MHFDVDEENREALELFMAMGNQWHCGPMGPVGMRIEALEPLMRAKRIPENRWPDLIDAMLAMEQAALLERQEKQ